MTARSSSAVALATARRTASAFATVSASARRATVQQTAARSRPSLYASRTAAATARASLANADAMRALEDPDVIPYSARARATAAGTACARRSSRRRAISSSDARVRLDSLGRPARSSRADVLVCAAHHPSPLNTPQHSTQHSPLPSPFLVLHRQLHRAWSVLQRDVPLRHRLRHARLLHRPASLRAQLLGARAVHRRRLRVPRWLQWPILQQGRRALSAELLRAWRVRRDVGALHLRRWLRRTRLRYG